MKPEEILAADIRAFTDIKEMLGIAGQEPAITFRWEESSYVDASNLRTILFDTVDKFIPNHPEPFIILEGVEKGLEVYFSASVARNTRLYSKLIREIRNRKDFAEVTKIFEWEDLQDVLVDSLMRADLANDLDSWDPELLNVISLADSLEPKLSLCRILANKSFLAHYIERMQDKGDDWCIFEILEESMIDIPWTKKSIKQWKSKRH